MQRIKLNIQQFASGIIGSTSRPSGGDVRIVWSSTANDNENKSTVNATAQVRRISSGTTSGTFNGTLTADGTNATLKQYRTNWTSDWKDVGSLSKTVSHNADGSKSINISVTLTQTGTSMAGTYKASATVTLDKINRASVLNEVDDFLITDNITLSITKYVSTFVDNLTIKCNNILIKTMNNVQNNEQISFTTEEQNLIKGQMVSPKINIDFILKTTDGTTELGTSQQTATCSSFDKPILFNYFKKSNGNYKVAINGLIDTTIESPLQVFDDNGNEILNGVVLYNNTTGSNSNITLSETTANFKYIEIFFRNNENSYGYTKVYMPNGKKITLSLCIPVDGYTYYKDAMASISGNKITFTIGAQVRIGNNVSTLFSKIIHIYITRVVGYK